ncbi:MAG TPA: ATP-grasp domain-containing protein [Candidatus Paceibacterota bacterium]|nr:ATP-grasp domain-containing protein [Candidatus Paceibacterota bacterium]
MHTIIGVLRGGPSREHDVSIKTGATILANLPEDRFIARDIYIDTQGRWHYHGRAVMPERILRQVDAVLIGLHGEYGEDGEVQRLLERFGIPYAGSDSFSSYVAMHKLMSKVRAQEEGLHTPKSIHIAGPEESEEKAQEIIRTFSQPVVVKPIGWGSSVGISIVGGYAPVLASITELFAQGASSVLVEEYIRGREATVGVVEGLRGEDLYTLPAIEIIPPDGDFFSQDAKYSGETREVCPGNFSRVTTEELQRLARVMHRALGLRHYSRNDFIVAANGIHYLETNTLPGLTAESLMPKSLAAVGVSLPDFFTHLVNLARTR